MFGVGRKKSKKPVVRSVAASESSEDDEDAQHRHGIQLQSKKKKGSSKKKKKNATNNTMLSFDPEDGGGLDNNDQLQKKKSKKRKKHSSSSSKHKKKSNSGGLGYGGLRVMMPNTSDGSEEDNDNMEIDSAPSGYDASALEKLKSEQKRTTLVKQDDEKKNEESVKVGNSNTDKDGSKSKPDEKESREEEFISLSGDNVLTGEEAMVFAKQVNDEMEFDHGLQSPPSPPLESSTNDKSVEKKVAGIDINSDMMMDVDGDNPSEVDEGNRQWEDITARRAGVLPPKSATSGRESRQQQGNNSSSSLGQIRSSLQPTISNLNNVYSDLETSISRHESKLSATQDEVSTKEITLQKHGKALEYYQGLREDLATWMGALRELNGMVKKVEDAKCKLEAEVSVRRRDRFVEWGEDCTEVLESSGLLKNKVLGKDVLAIPSSTQPNTAQVDEFGRDLSSMASISRVKRCNQRRKRCLNRLQQDSSSMTDNTLDQSAEYYNDDNFDTADFDEWEQRHTALMQAIDIIPTLVKDDYLSISNICTLFCDWERAYPDDYKNCYANMSLVQMTSVLVRLELCSLNVLDTNSTQDLIVDVSEFKWFQDLKKTIRVVDSAVEKETRPRKSILLEVVQKQIVDRLLDSISFDDENKEGSKQHGIYDPFSIIQTKRMCSLLSSLLKYFSSASVNDGKMICKEIVDKILNKLISFLKHTLSRTVVPIAVASKITMRGNEFVMKEGDSGFDSETTDAISYSTIVQAKEFCTLVNNILGLWYPVLNETCEPDKVSSLVQFVFADILSLRLLPILTSLHDISSSGDDKNEQYTNLAKTMINGILDTVNAVENGDDDWMLMTAPLRVLVEQWS